MTKNPALLTIEEKLKASLYYSVSKICKSVGNDNTIVGQFNFSNEAIELISEIVYKKLELYGEDLEAFAKNRKQSTVNTDDVKLLTRQNPNLNELISKMLETKTSIKNDKKKKGKTTKPGTSTKTLNSKIEVMEID